jgi:hypothetical protein
VPTEHGRVNITRLEDDGFWAWAIIETLRHTGLFSGGLPCGGASFLTFAQLRG